MNPRTRERRPGQGAALQNPRLTGDGIDSIVLRPSDDLKITVQVDFQDLGGWSFIPLVERVPLAEMVVLLPDGTELVAHFNRRPSVPTFLEVDRACTVAQP